MGSREPEGPALEPMIRQVVREELRRCGLRPAMPGVGVWRWSVEADAWEPVA